MASWACWTAGVALVKIFASVFSAVIYALHRGTNRNAGNRFGSAWTNSVASTAVASAEVRFGTS